MTDANQPPWMQGWKPAPPPPEAGIRPVGNPNWYPGMTSPNPGGRPRGITDRKAKLVQRMLDDAEGIVEAIIQKALDGDSNSASLILSRVLPSIKAQAEKVQIDDFDPSLPVSAQVESILRAVAAGAVSADVAKQIIDSVGTLASVRMSEDLEARIAALEEAKVG